MKNPKIQLAGKNFNEKVWLACSKIPKGKVSTYKEIARAIGRPNAFRAAGNALNKNPYAFRVPCHRVVGHRGRLGGYAHGVRAKIALLKKEGIEVRKRHIINLNKVLITGKYLKNKL